MGCCSSKRNTAPIQPAQRIDSTADNDVLSEALAIANRNFYNSSPEVTRQTSWRKSL